MAKKSDEFSKNDLMRLLRQPETQALLARLQQLDSGALQQAAQRATQGDATGAKEALAPLLQDEQVRRLTEEMRQRNG